MRSLLVLSYLCRLCFLRNLHTGTDIPHSVGCQVIPHSAPLALLLGTQAGLGKLPRQHVDLLSLPLREALPLPRGLPQPFRRLAATGASLVSPAPLLSTSLPPVMAWGLVCSLVSLEMEFVLLPSFLLSFVALPGQQGGAWGVGDLGHLFFFFL